MSKLQVAYLRVSTETQTEKYGLDMQKQKIMDYCEKHGITIDKWYIDGGYSGSKLDRPEMQELLEHAKSGIIDTVYIYKLDRMSRDVIDTLTLFYKTLPGYGVKVVSMTEELRTENPMDRMMLTMNAAMNQYEREVIRMRMSSGMVERVKNGFWPGGGNVPVGYYYDRNDGILHIDNKKADMVRDTFRLYLDGYSCIRIADILGFSCERIVVNILKRKTYIGLIEYKGNVYKGKHESIIDEETFYKVQEMHKKRSTNAHVSRRYLLTGLCYCGVCGARMRYHQWNGINPRIVCYSQYGKDYMARDRNCNNLKPHASHIESEVEECFKQFAINVKQKDKQKDDPVNKLKVAIKKEEDGVKRLYLVYAENPTKNLMDVIKETEKKITRLNKKLLEESSRKEMNNSKKIQEIRRVSDVWDTLTTQEKNKILKECIEKVVISGNDLEIRFITF